MASIKKMSEVIIPMINVTKQGQYLVFAKDGQEIYDILAHILPGQLDNMRTKRWWSIGLEEAALALVGV
jgi:TPP-dependent 2-oxoacid decarboxylase